MKNFEKKQIEETEDVSNKTSEQRSFIDDNSSIFERTSNSIDDILTDVFDENELVQDDFPDIKIIDSDYGTSQKKLSEKISYEEAGLLTENDLIEELELLPLEKSEKDEESEIQQIQENDLSSIKKQMADEEVVKEEIKHSDILSDSINHVYENDTLFSDIQNEIDFDILGNDISISSKNDQFYEENVSNNQSLQMEEFDLNEVNEIDENTILDNDEEEIVYNDREDGVAELLFDNVKSIPILANDEALKNQFLEVLDIAKIDEFEKVPERFAEFENYKNLKFIDDDYIYKSEQSDIYLNNSDSLKESFVDMVYLIDGRMNVIDKILSPQDRINYTLEYVESNLRPAVEEIERDEISYDDSDLDFVENSIMRDDYGHYIQEIDEYYQPDFLKSDSEIAEILGLVNEEVSIFQDRMFGEYYSKIDVDSEIEFLTTNLDFFDRGYLGEKEVDYILANPDSFLTEEKISIEEDISSEKAVIFEEDVEDLIQILKDEYPSVEQAQDSVGIADSVIKDEKSYKESELLDVVDTEKIQDITDRVIILEDQNETEMFTSQYPDKKEDLVKLFSYLDGLFEKLPEETVKKFAESEYFDLYARVLKDMGV